MSYLNKTKDGYQVVSLYIKKDSWGPNGTLLAIIQRKEDWLWAYDYRPEYGAWGNGHYMFDSKAEAIADMKHDYPNAKLVSRSSIIKIKSPTDSFGWYATKTEAMKRAYYLTKHRKEEMSLYKPSVNLKEIGHTYSYNYNVIYFQTYDKVYRLYADGSLKVPKA